MPSRPRGPRSPGARRRAPPLGLLVGLLTLPPLASARAADTCDPQPEVMASSACPAVFGDAGTRRVNRALRVDAIERIDVGEHCIDLVHSASWYTPSPIHYRSLSLLDTRQVEGCPPLALVHLDSDVVDVDCPSGVYALRVDDALGASARVVAILDGVVLIESEDALAYLRAEDAEQPVWRLTWQSPWRFKVPKDYGKAKPGRPAKRKQPARRPAKKRRR